MITGMITIAIMLTVITKTSINRSSAWANGKPDPSLAVPLRTCVVVKIVPTGAVQIRSAVQAGSTTNRNPKL